MSLNYDYTRVDGEKYPPTAEGNMNPVTYSMIWATMSIGMGQPERDPKEWVKRGVILSRLVGLFEGLVDEGTPEENKEQVLMEMLWDHRELHTNVANETRPAFFKRLRAVIERQMDMMSRDIDQALDEMENR